MRDMVVVDEEEVPDEDAARGALVDALIEELERLPAQPSVAVRTVWVADQPNSSAKDLAAALTADPSLTARVLRLANSAYYGLSGRVRRCGRHGARGVGARTGRRVGGAGGAERGQRERRGREDAGAATRSAALRGDGHWSVSEQARPHAEEEHHDEAAARVFSAWRFPETFIEAVADHHAHPATLSEPHSLLLVAAESVAARLVTCDSGGYPLTPGLGAELEHGQNAGLRALGLDVTDALAIARQVEDDVAQLLQAFSS